MNIFRYSLWVILVVLMMPAQVFGTHVNPTGDSSWDWTVDHEVQLYVPDANPIKIALPFFSNQGQCAEFLYDNSKLGPKDGWELVTVDFGREDRQTALPNFWLYNRYQGLLRIIYWPFGKASQEGYSHAKVVLNFHKDSSRLRFLGGTGAEDESLYLRTYDAEKFAAVFKPIINNTWNCADFHLVDFEPSAKKYQKGATFLLTVSGIKESDVTLEGKITPPKKEESGPLPQTISATAGIKEVQGNQSVSSDTETEAPDLVGVFKKGAETYKDIDSVASKVKDWADKKYISLGKEAQGQDELNELLGNGGPSGFDAALGKFQLLEGVAGLAKAAPVVGGIVSAGLSLFDFFSGGSSTPQIVHISGDVELGGEISETHRIANQVLRVPGTKKSGRVNTAEPFYDKPLGIFGLVNKPVFTYRPDWEFRPPCGWSGSEGPLFFHMADQLKLVEPIQYVFNQEAGLDLISIDAGFVRTGESIKEADYVPLAILPFVNYKLNAQVPRDFDPTKEGWVRVKSPSRNLARQILAERKLSPIDNKKGRVEDVTLWNNCDFWADPYLGPQDFKLTDMSEKSMNPYFMLLFDLPDLYMRITVRPKDPRNNELLTTWIRTIPEFKPDPAYFKEIKEKWREIVPKYRQKCAELGEECKALHINETELKQMVLRLNYFHSFYTPKRATVVSFEKNAPGKIIDTNIRKTIVKFEYAQPNPIVALDSITIGLKEKTIKINGAHNLLAGKSISFEGDIELQPNSLFSAELADKKAANFLCQECYQ